MMYPKITVVTPTFNQAKYIEQTIKSIIDQNYPNLEYIIIDGGSSDGTVEIIQKYQDKLAYWISEQDNGLYDAINKGFNIATGDILAWLNSDDIYLPNSLFSVAEIFSNFPEVEWLQGANSHIDEIGKIVSVFPAGYWTKFDLASGDKRNIQQESTFFRKSLWERSGKPLNINSQLAGDYALWFIFFRYADLITTTAPLGCFRMRSSNQKSYSQLAEYNLEKSIYQRQNKKYCKPKFSFLIYSFLHKLGVFNLLKMSQMEVQVKQLLFNGPKKIIFNRANQKFEYR